MPQTFTVPDDPQIDGVLHARNRAVGGGTVRRTLPHAKRRRVGPFCFFDHMGPVDVPAGVYTDVAPHPHIGLATITYLFDGATTHRDSLGNEVMVLPGSVHLMVAGDGIVHSERTPQHLRGAARHLHGLQLWIALPTEREHGPPSFHSYPSSDLPSTTVDHGVAHVLIGEAYGEVSPVIAPSPALYVELRLDAGARVAVPCAQEVAVYAVDQTVVVGRTALKPGEMALIASGAVPDLHAPTGGRVMVIGGDALDGPRHMWWNFVATDPADIEAAKDRWRRHDFPDVPGDDGYIPLP